MRHLQVNNRAHRVCLTPQLAFEGTYRLPTLLFLSYCYLSNLSWGKSARHNQFDRHMDRRRATDVDLCDGQTRHHQWAPRAARSQRLDVALLDVGIELPLLQHIVGVARGKVQRDWALGPFVLLISMRTCCSRWTQVSTCGSALHYRNHSKCV